MTAAALQHGRISDADIERAKEGIVGTISKYLDLKKAGKDHSALCPFHSERTPSFTVSEGKSFYHCHGCGAHGDAIDFVMEHEGITFHEAVKSIVGSLPASGAAPQKRQVERQQPVEEWRPVVPVPASAGAPMEVFNRRSGDAWEKLTASRKWAYRDADGQLTGYICRFELPGGGKDLIPQSFCVNSQTGEMRWKWLSFAKPRPIYGLEKLTKHPKAQVIIVEGEKACDKAQERYEAAGISRDKLIVLSWPGGGKAVKHVDWSPLAGRNVGLWPDADQKPYVDTHKLAGQLMPFIEQPGTVCMVEIANRVEGIATSVKFITPPAKVPDGWDLGDPLPEGLNLLAYTKLAAKPMGEFRERHMLDPAPTATPAALTTVAPKPALVDVGNEQESIEAPVDQEAKVVKQIAATLKAQTDFPMALDDAEGALDDQQDATTQDDIALGAGFLVLGYDRDVLFIYSHERQQVITTSVQKLSKDAGLIELADLQWWETVFGEAGKGLKPKIAANWVARIAAKRGVYDADRVRGRGAWLDDGQALFHLGNRLMIDGKLAEIGSLRSRYVYEARPTLRAPDATPLSSRDGADLLRVARMFRWENNNAAELLMGWLLLAPICGLLKWRPHIWIGAAPGAGKSTLMNNFITPLLPDRWALHEQGLSTEAALRQKLVADARPVLLDEFEGNTDADRRRIEGVLTLIRLSSSSGEISRGTVSGRALTFTARSMFCLASVGVGLHRQTDEDRITRLELTKNGDTADKWALLEGELLKIALDEKIGQRLFARSLDRLDMVRETVELFTKGAGAHFKSQRHGDQYGTLLAGCWCLTHDRKPTEREVLDEMRGDRWADLGAGATTNSDDSIEALNALLCSSIRLDGGKTLTVSQLIENATLKGGLGEENPKGLFDVSRKESDHQLQLYGIRVDTCAGHEKNGEVMFAMAHRQLTSLVSESDFATDLLGRLARLPGARKSREGQPKAKIRFAGAALRYLALPLELCLSQDEEDERLAVKPSASQMPRDHNDYQSGQAF